MVGLSVLETRTLDELRRQLGGVFGGRLTGFVLFGSRARGEGRDDSDLDVLVEITDVTPAERRLVQDLGADIGTASGLVLSPLVRPSGWQHMPSPLAHEIERDGRTTW